MGKTKIYHPVKLIMGVSTADIGLWEKLRPQLEAVYSPIDLQLDWYKFDHTKYYTKEMGNNLLKCFVSFEEFINVEALPGIKHATNAIEKAYAVDGKRRINLDPGYINAPKLVLATTKDFSHRIYLQDGIFGDIHLKFRGKNFKPQEWTYPDYREPFVLKFFEKVRDVYMEQIGLESV